MFDFPKTCFIYNTVMVEIQYRVNILHRHQSCPPPVSVILLIYPGQTFSFPVHFAHFPPVWMLKDERCAGYLPQISYPTDWNENI